MASARPTTVYGTINHNTRKYVPLLPPNMAGPHGAQCLLRQQTAMSELKCSSGIPSASAWVQAQVPCDNARGDDVVLYLLPCSVRPGSTVYDMMLTAGTARMVQSFS